MEKSQKHVVFFDIINIRINMMTCISVIMSLVFFLNGNPFCFLHSIQLPIWLHQICISAFRFFPHILLNAFLFHLSKFSSEICFKLYFRTTQCSLQSSYAVSLSHIQHVIILPNTLLIFYP